MADESTETEGRPQPKFPEGTVVVYGTTTNGTPQLCVTTEPRWDERTGAYYYGQLYIGRPELGYPNGGASFSWPEGRYWLPQTGYEQLLALQYKQRAKAREAEANLKDAKSAADAMDRALEVFLADRNQ